MKNKIEHAIYQRIKQVTEDSEYDKWQVEGWITSRPRAFRLRWRLYQHFWRLGIKIQTRVKYPYNNNISTLHYRKIQS